MLMCSVYNYLLSASTHIVSSNKVCYESRVVNPMRIENASIGYSPII